MKNENDRYKQDNGKIRYKKKWEKESESGNIRKQAAIFRTHTHTKREFYEITKVMMHPASLTSSRNTITHENKAKEVLREIPFKKLIFKTKPKIKRRIISLQTIKICQKYMALEQIKFIT